MARQRFIWPALWTDKTFGELKHDEQILFIALFSLADDEGRISADPAFLRAQVFPYKTYSVKRVQGIRDRVVAAVEGVHLYRAAGAEIIALLKWHDYQKPKYPKPSTIPAPFPHDSPNADGTFRPRVGLGRDGLDWEGQGWDEKVAAVAELSSAITNKDEGTEAMLASFALVLPAAAFYEAHSELNRKGVTILNDGAYVRTILERMVAEGQYAA